MLLEAGFGSEMSLSTCFQRPEFQWVLCILPPEGLSDKGGDGGAFPRPELRGDVPVSQQRHPVFKRGWSPY